MCVSLNRNEQSPVCVCVQVYGIGTAVGGLGLALQPHKGVSQAYRPRPEPGQNGEVIRACTHVHQNCLGLGVSEVPTRIQLSLEHVWPWVMLRHVALGVLKLYIPCPWLCCVCGCTECVLCLLLGMG